MKVILVLSLNLIIFGIVTEAQKCDCPKNTEREPQPLCGEKNGKKRWHTKRCYMECYGYTEIDRSECVKPRTCDQNCDKTEEIPHPCGQEGGQKVAYANRCIMECNTKKELDPKECEGHESYTTG